MGEEMSSDGFHVGHLLNSAGRGGAEMLTLELIRHTDRDDVSYTVYYLGSDHTLASDFADAGARVVDIGARTSPPQLDPSVAPKLLARIAKDDPDVLHGHMPYVQVIGRIASCLPGPDAAVSTVHTLEETLPYVSQRLTSLTQPLDSATVAVSEGVRNSYTRTSDADRDDGAGRDWRTIYNGIDASEFNSKIERLSGSPSVADAETDGVRFVNIGRFVPEKAQFDLLEAMEQVRERLPDSHLYLVGSSGPLQSELRQRVARSGLQDHVSVVYHDSNEFDIHSFYGLADVFVSSSILEGMPMTHLEAMAAELPIVATDILGVREIIEDGRTGVLVPPNSPDRLAEAMVSFSSASKRREFGRNGFRRVERRFSIERTVDAYLDLYREVLSDDA